MHKMWKAPELVKKFKNKFKLYNNSNVIHSKEYNIHYLKFT